MAKATDPLPIFYSLNRFIDHEACISAGSVKICRALFKLSHSSHLQDVKGCRKHGLKVVVLTGIGGQSKPLREAGVLHVDAADGK